MRPAIMHKGSGFAVNNAQARWYIAECKPTKEGTIRTMLTNADYEVYVASKVEEVVYKSRNRRKKETVLIPGKVFVRTEEAKLMDIMLGFSSVYRFMLNRLSRDRSFAYIPDDQMQQLQYVLGKAENPIYVTSDSLKLNQRVKVMRGALSGFEGWFFQESHSAYVVVKMEMGTNHYIFTEVPIEDIQPL